MGLRRQTALPVIVHTPGATFGPRTSERAGHNGKMRFATKTSRLEIVGLPDPSFPNQVRSNRVSDQRLEWTDTDRRAVDTIRLLAADAVQKTGNGHPGTAMSLAPAA